jgi:hypothetical protein
MLLDVEEPDAGPWDALDDQALTERVRQLLAGGHRPVVLVEGRGGAGKSTIAERLAGLLGGTVVHTDTIAWNHSRFGWADLVTNNVIAPWRRGTAIDYRPPGWASDGHPGSVKVPADSRALLVEGVGAGRAALAAHADLVVWVQSDRAEARRRGLARDIEQGRPPTDADRVWDDWMMEEEPFLAADRPWTRADLVVNSTPDPPPDPLITWVARG